MDQFRLRADNTSLPSKVAEIDTSPYKGTPACQMRGEIKFATASVHCLHAVQAFGHHIMGGEPALEQASADSDRRAVAPLAGGHDASGPPSPALAPVIVIVIVIVLGAHAPAGVGSRWRGR